MAYVQVAEDLLFQSDCSEPRGRRHVSTMRDSNSGDAMSFCWLAIALLDVIVQGTVCISLSAALEGFALLTLDDL